MTKYKNKRVLVTGADGFIGSHLVEKLVAETAEVTALAQYNSFESNGWLDTLSDDVYQSIVIRRGDVRDAEFVRRLVIGQDVVFHLAALIGIPYSYEAPHAYVEVNAVGTLNILEAARDYQTGRVVQTSTSEVYGSAQFTPVTEDHPLQGQSPYSASKIAADKLAEAYACSFDLPVVVLRPFNTFGPRQSERAVIPTIIRQALDPGCDAICLGSLTPKRDFTFVEDVAEAFSRIGSAENLEYGAPYNAGCGRAISIGGLAESVRGLVGTAKPIENDSDRMRPEASEVMELIASNERFRTATGWQPAFDLKAGLSRTIEWWRGRLERGEVRRGDGYSI